MCFKCGEVKSLSLFYKHPKMADGHVNKCKECNKSDVAEHRNLNLCKVREYDRGRRKKCSVDSERWKELCDKEKERQLHNFAELRLKQRTRLKRYREENPKKYAAHSKVGAAVKGGKLKVGVCAVCGSHKALGHHNDYDKPLEVTWLCSEHHMLWHTEHGEGANAH